MNNKIVRQGRIRKVKKAKGNQMFSSFQFVMYFVGIAKEPFPKPARIHIKREDIIIIK